MEEVFAAHKKQYPRQYPQQAVRVLRAMSFTDGKDLELVGSASLQNQLYFGDYDADETVDYHSPTDKEALQKLVKRFQEMIRNLKTIPDTYIGDIKAGIIEEWRVVDGLPSTTIKSLLEKGIITSKEAKEAEDILTSKSYEVAKAEIKFHIIRWTPQEILKGSKTLRDGRNYTLEEGFHSPSIVKLDTIALVLERYTELSVIYNFENNGKVLNPTEMDVEESLKESIEVYKQEGNPFKVLKRRYALAKYNDDTEQVKRLAKVLNSSLGLLYVVYSDVKTLADLLEQESLPKEKVEEAIQAFKDKLIIIYQKEQYLKKEQGLLQDLEEISKSPSVNKLRVVEKELFAILSKQTKLFSI